MIKMYYTCLAYTAEDSIKLVHYNYNNIVTGKK